MNQFEQVISSDEIGKKILAITVHENDVYFSTSTDIYQWNETCLTHIAGCGKIGLSIDGSSAKEAMFNNPHSLCVINGGDICVTDTLNHLVLKIKKDGTIEHIMGDGIEGNPSQSMIAKECRLKTPFCIMNTIIKGNNVLYVDHMGDNDEALIIDPHGNVQKTKRTKTIFNYSESSKKTGFNDYYRAIIRDSMIFVKESVNTASINIGEYVKQDDMRNICCSLSNENTLFYSTRDRISAIKIPRFLMGATLDFEELSRTIVRLKRGPLFDQGCNYSWKNGTSCREWSGDVQVMSRNSRENIIYLSDDGYRILRLYCRFPDENDMKADERDGELSIYPFLIESLDPGLYDSFTKNRHLFSERQIEMVYKLVDHVFYESDTFPEEDLFDWLYIISFTKLPMGRLFSELNRLISLDNCWDVIKKIQPMTQGSTMMKTIYNFAIRKCAWFLKQDPKFAENPSIVNYILEIAPHLPEKEEPKLSIQDTDNRLIKLDLTGYFNNPNKSDITVVIGESRYYCHRAILSSASRYFRSMFSSFLESSQNEYIVDTEIFSADYHKRIIEYCYGIYRDGPQDIMEMVEVCQYYLTDRLAIYLCGKIDFSHLDPEEFVDKCSKLYKRISEEIDNKIAAEIRARKRGGLISDNVFWQDIYNILDL